VTGLARLRPTAHPALAHRARTGPTDPGLDTEPGLEPGLEPESEPEWASEPAPELDVDPAPGFPSASEPEFEAVPVVRHVSPAAAAVARPALVPRRTTRAVSSPAVERPVLTKAVDDYVGEAREPLVPHRTTELDRLFHQQEALGTGNNEMLALALAGYTSSVAAPPPRADDPKPTPRPSATERNERTRRRASLAQSRRLGLTANPTPSPEPPADPPPAAEPPTPNESDPPTGTAPVDTARIDTKPTMAVASPDLPPVLDTPATPTKIQPVVPASVTAVPAKTPPVVVVPVATPQAAAPAKIPLVVDVPTPMEVEPVTDRDPATTPFVPGTAPAAPDTAPVAPDTAPVAPGTAEPTPHQSGPIQPAIPSPTDQQPTRRLGLGAPLTNPPRRSQPRPPEPVPHAKPVPPAVPESVSQALPEPEPDTVDVPQDVAATFRSAFGVDVGNVAVHRGSAVTEQAQSVSARAFTRHGEVYLPEPAGHLDAPATKALLAHELVHAVQQRALGTGLPPEESPPGAELEAEAVATEHWFLGTGPTPTALVHRPTTPQPPEAPTTPAPQRSPGLHPSLPPPLAPQPLVPQPPPAPPIEHLPDTTLTWPPPDVVLPPATPTPTPTEQPTPPPPPEFPDLAQLKKTVERLEHTVTELDGRRPKPPTPRELDDLAHRLYRRIRGNMRRELLVDRERAGRLADLR
jgi:hypothetical protein